MTLDRASVVQSRNFPQLAEDINAIFKLLGLKNQNVPPTWKINGKQLSDQKNKSPKLNAMWKLVLAVLTLFTQYPRNAGCLPELPESEIEKLPYPAD